MCDQDHFEKDREEFERFMASRATQGPDTKES